MEKTPVYLIWFLLKIRRHSREPGYLKKRFDSMDEDKMLLEVAMLDELHEYGYIALPKEREERVFNPIEEEVEPNVHVIWARTQTSIPYPASFAVLPRGHYAIREVLAGLAGRTAWAIAVAAIGVVVGLVIAA